LERFYASVVPEAVPRLYAFGVGTVIETYRQSGFFGLGLGMATQGTQHIAVDRPNVWQEGGMDKAMAELGVPGFAALLFLVAVYAVSAVRATRQSVGTPEYPLYAGLSAMLAASVAGGIVSAQIIGDPFVAAFISFLAGLVLSGHRLRVVLPTATP
jgi:hypothetical protein